MHAQDKPHTDIVLIGGGHTHALVLKSLTKMPIPGARITLINPTPRAAYSGMLPGHIAGHYTRDDILIDLVSLTQRANARFIVSAVTAMDAAGKTITLANGDTLEFDLASLDTGITSGLPQRDDLGPGTVRAKPFGPFVEAWESFVNKVQAGLLPPDACVIGAGLGGVELALAMNHRLRSVAPQSHTVRVSLIEASPTILPGETASLRKVMTRALNAAEIALITADRAETGPSGGVLTLRSGRAVACGFAVLVSGARPAGWLSHTGLTLQDGFVSVDPTLRSVSHPDIFACGDIAHLSHAPRPKAGVFAVRQAPVLLANLRAATARNPSDTLQNYTPQRDYLKLVSLGSQNALASKWGLGLRAPGLWAWKDRIDRRFMDAFQHTPDGGDAKTSAIPDLCGACGAKVGASILTRALAALPPPDDPSIEAAPGDDAAILNLSGTRQLLTVDTLRPFSADPALLARALANHALNDIHAMGGVPHGALVSLTLPPLAPRLEARTLQEIMQVLAAALRAQGCTILGGHTARGPELQLGLTVTGLMPEGRQPLRISGAQPGDRLVLTGALGTGVILAAAMLARANGEDVARVWQSLARSRAAQAQALSPLAHAMTDVTGFGLAGHLGAMMKASGTSAHLSLNALPALPGALTLLEKGHASSLQAENADLARAIAATPEQRADPRFALLFDPQTNGPFLASVPQGVALPDHPELHLIGTVAPARPDALIVLT